MSTPVFKSPPARQLRLARHSRELWKQRAAEKQRALKKLRITVRDLTVSRDLWKHRALELADQLASLPPQLPQDHLFSQAGPCLGGD